MLQYTQSHDCNGNYGGGSSSSDGMNKKKFGKNLNNLVKLSAPPISSDEMDHNVKKGHLLLTTPTKQPSY